MARAIKRLKPRKIKKPPVHPTGFLTTAQRRALKRPVAVIGGKPIYGWVEPPKLKRSRRRRIR